MAGLLDFEDPNTVGALQFGMGLLNAGGPSRMPVSLGQGIAQAGTGALDSMRQARNDQVSTLMRNAQMEELKRKQLKDLRQQQVLEAFGASITDPAERQRFMVDPEAYVKQMNEFKNVDPTHDVYRGGVRVSAGLPKERKAPEGMQYDQAGNLIEIPGYVAMRSKIAAAGRSPQQAERPYFTPVADASRGMGTFDNRTGRYTFDSSAPMVKPGDSPSLQGKIAEAKKLGTDTGEQKAQLAIKEGAVESIGEAKKMLSSGIYSGGWGPTQKNIMKFTPGMDKTKVARTEEFVSHIGNVVVPRLKEFGGNDSNEELKYLKGITGGDIQIEPAALKAILDSAEVKMKRNIERLKGRAVTSNNVRVVDW